MEILSRHLKLTTELTRGKLHHVLSQFIGCISLFCPKTVGGGSPRQAAALIFLAASTRTRVIPADFLADMKTHNVATLAQTRRKQEAKVFDPTAQRLASCTAFSSSPTTGAKSCTYMGHESPVLFGLCSKYANLFEVEISQIHVALRQYVYGENVLAFAEMNFEKLRSHVPVVPLTPVQRICWVIRCRDLQRPSRVLPVHID
jgi:hypothetical protein